MTWASLLNEQSLQCFPWTYTIGNISNEYLMKTYNMTYIFSFTDGCDCYGDGGMLAQRESQEDETLRCWAGWTL